MPRNFKFTASSIYLSLLPMVNVQYGRFYVTNFIMFVFSRFKTNTLAENHSVKCARTKFTVVENSVKFLLEIITLVTSAKNIGSTRDFIRNER